MKELKEYDISFIGLKEGKHNFEYQIDKEFFDEFEYDDFDQTAIEVSLAFVKKPTMLELHFSFEGTVNIPCDVSGQPFDLAVSGEMPLLVKFAEDYNNDNEEILYVPYGEYKINTAHYIFEMIVLAIPAKRVHPQVLDGTIAVPLYNDALEHGKNKETNTEDTTDPRWGKLKDLLIDKTERNGTSKEKDI